MFVTPPQNSQVQALLSTIGRSPDVLEWLEKSRQDILEMLSQAPEETRLRQLQGASIVLKELITIFNRTP
jgi:hypothetical protein